MSSFRLLFFKLAPVVGAVLMSGACGVPLAVSGAGYAADGGLLAASNKTSSDHIISMVSKQDCALWRVVKRRALCTPRDGDKDPYSVDYDDPQPTVAEDGVHYGPPLRAAAGAPATSWDAASYKKSVVLPRPPGAPVAALAQGSDGGPPTAIAESVPLSPPPVKVRKPAKHSIKKASRHPAAAPS